VEKLAKTIELFRFAQNHIKSIRKLDRTGPICKHVNTRHSTYDLFCCAVVGQPPHAYDDGSPSRQERLSLRTLPSGHREEVLARGPVDLDVPLADVVLVPLQRHVSVLLTLELDQRLPVPSSLWRQTQSYAAPANRGSLNRHSGAKSDLIGTAE
jgi:hypothetical protein